MFVDKQFKSLNEINHSILRNEAAIMKEIDHYLASVDEARREDFQQLFEVIQANIPAGFELDFDYKMIGFSVPLSAYPNGYLNRKNEPVPFIRIAAQKRYISLYHMGIIVDKELLTWFQDEYAKVSSTKLNMGKSCIRFTNSKNIPFELMGELVRKVSMKEWIATYEKLMAPSKK